MDWKTIKSELNAAYSEVYNPFFDSDEYKCAEFILDAVATVDKRVHVDRVTKLEGINGKVEYFKNGKLEGFIDYIDWCNLLKQFALESEDEPHFKAKYKRYVRQNYL